MMITTYATDAMLSASPGLVAFSATMMPVAIAIIFIACTHPRYFGWLYRRLRR